MSRTNTDTRILVNILQRMYNDNIRQINNLTNFINSIRTNNNEIRNQLFQILFSENSLLNSNGI